MGTRTYKIEISKRPLYLPSKVVRNPCVGEVLLMMKKMVTDQRLVAVVRDAIRICLMRGYILLLSKLFWLLLSTPLLDATIVTALHFGLPSEYVFSQLCSSR